MSLRARYAWFRGEISHLDIWCGRDIFLRGEEEPSISIAGFTSLEQYVSRRSHPIKIDHFPYQRILISRCTRNTVVWDYSITTTWLEASSDGGDVSLAGQRNRLLRRGALHGVSDVHRTQVRTVHFSSHLNTGSI